MAFFLKDYKVILTKLRFENSPNKKNAQASLAFFLKDYKVILTKLRFENSPIRKNAQASLAFFLIGLFIRDPGRIQTCNPQSRNLMRYSVAPRSLIYSANLGKFLNIPPINSPIYNTKLCKLRPNNIGYRFSISLTC